MAFFVFVDAFWAEVDPLADAAGSLVCGRRCHGFQVVFWRICMVYVFGGIWTKSEDGWGVRLGSKENYWKVHVMAWSSGGEA